MKLKAEFWSMSNPPPPHTAFIDLQAAICEILEWKWPIGGPTERIKHRTLVFGVMVEKSSTSLRIVDMIVFVLSALCECFLWKEKKLSMKIILFWLSFRREYSQSGDNIVTDLSKRLPVFIFLLAVC